MTVQDIKTQKVSRWCSVALLVVSVAARLVFCVGEERVGFVASAAIGLLVFEAVRLVVKKRLGLADVFYSGSSGALLGFNYWLAACAIACAAAAGVIYLRVRRATRTGEEFTKDAVLRMPVPFIPCIFFGTIVAKIISFV
ncbi:MAG: prepilin peptidase [Treponemataceae bacterium]|nr:prepilin peptidase [Treponemataceae bacterium]